MMKNKIEVKPLSEETTCKNCEHRNLKDISDNTCEVDNHKISLDDWCEYHSIDGSKKWEFKLIPIVKEYTNKDETTCINCSNFNFSYDIDGFCEVCRIDNHKIKPNNWCDYHTIDGSKTWTKKIQQPIENSPKNPNRALGISLGIASILLSIASDYIPFTLLNGPILPIICCIAAIILGFISIAFSSKAYKFLGIVGIIISIISFIDVLNVYNQALSNFNK